MPRCRFRLKRSQKDSYMGLIQELPLVSIRSAWQLRVAQAVMDHLLSQGKLDAGEVAVPGTALSDLAAAYEDEHYAIELRSDADIIRHLLESEGRGAERNFIGRPAFRVRRSQKSFAGEKPFSGQQSFASWPNTLVWMLMVLAANL